MSTKIKPYLDNNFKNGVTISKNKVINAYHKFIEKKKAKALKEEQKIKLQETEALEKKEMDIGYHERVINLSVYANPFGFNRSNYSQLEIQNILESK